MAPRVESAVVQTLKRQMEDLGAAVAGADEATSSMRKPDGQWSVKEQLSHLYGADGDTFLDRVQAFFGDEEPVVDIDPGITHFDASRKAMPLDELLTRVQAQYMAVAELIGQASAEELERRGHIALLAQTPFGDRPTLAQFVEVISTMHLAGHLEQLRQR